jgi:hypothetical protein
MFDFDKQYKEFEQLSERTKQAYEFWYNCVMDAWKDLLNKKK